MKPASQSPSSPLLHANANRATLEVCLLGFFAIWFVRYLVDPLQTLSSLPFEYSSPIGLLRWLPDSVRQTIYSEAGLSTIRFGLLACCIGVWIRPYRAHFAISGCLLLTLAASITRSFGHINHAEIGPILITWVLTLFYLRMPARSEHQVAAENSTASSGMITACLVLSLVYAFVGIARICNGGPQLFLGDTIPNHVAQGSSSNWVLEHNLAPLVWNSAFVAWSLKMGTIAVTILEIATPFALVSRRIRYAVLLVMPLFHFGAILMFKVVFIEQPLALILFLNLTPMIQQASQKLPFLSKQSQAASSAA